MLNPIHKLVNEILLPTVNRVGDAAELSKILENEMHLNWVIRFSPAIAKRLAVIVVLKDTDVATAEFKEELNLFHDNTCDVNSPISNSTMRLIKTLFDADWTIEREIACTLESVIWEEYSAKGILMPQGELLRQFQLDHHKWNVKELYDSISKEHNRALYASHNMIQESVECLHTEQFMAFSPKVARAIAELHVKAGTELTAYLLEETLKEFSKRYMSAELLSVQSLYLNVNRKTVAPRLVTDTKEMLEKEWFEAKELVEALKALEEM